MKDRDNPIDWQEILRITNNKPELAKEMVAMLGDELPGMKKQISKAFKNKDYEILLNHIHKLHGSCCYCGVPALKEVTAQLETNLKQKKYHGLNEQLYKLNQEIDHILQYINYKATT